MADMLTVAVCDDEMVCCKEIAAMIEGRRAAYEAAADVTVDTDGKSPEEVAEEILRAVS